jgi:enoyl-CoA hydratase/carnithine racemase
MGDEGWSYTTQRRVATFTIERESKLNALDQGVLDGLGEAVRRVQEDGDVRALVLRGAGGRSFSTGIDLGWFLAGGMMTDAGKSLRFTAMIHDRLRVLEECTVPTIAAVDGFALAGGLELALACDLLVCSDESRLGDQHANYALVPGAGGSQRLPRRVGEQRALELMLTGRHVDGREAVDIGLALSSAPASDFGAMLDRLLDGLRGKSRAGLTHLKLAVRRGRDLALRDALEMERLTTQEYFSGHPDALEGLREFLDR